MNSVLFKEWISMVDRIMRKAGQKVLEKSPSLPNDLKLSNIKVEFLPANTSSELQPLGKTIMHNFKHFYRKKYAGLLESVRTRLL
jgi:hypothetical protein